MRYDEGRLSGFGEEAQVMTPPPLFEAMGFDRINIMRQLESNRLKARSASSEDGKEVVG